MRKQELEKLKDVATKTQQSLREQMLQLDTQYKSLIGFSLIDNIDNFIIPVGDILKAKLITGEEAEQMHLFDSETTLLSQQEQKRLETTSKLFALFYSMVDKNVIQKLKTLTAAQYSKYTKTQRNLFYAIAEYAAILVILEAIDNITTSYRTHTKETFTAYVQKLYIATIAKEGVNNHFDFVIGERIEKVIAEAFEKTEPNQPTITTCTDPTNFIMNNTKIAHSIPGATIGQNTAFETCVAEKGGKNPMTISALFDLEIDPQIIQGLEHLNMFDMGVSNVVATIFKNGDNTFTDEQIAKALAGTNRIKGNSITEEVHKSLLRQMGTIITIDCSQQATLYTGLQHKTVIGGNMLNLRFIKDKAKYTNGKEVKATTYQIIAKPPLLDYAERTGQLITYSKKALTNSPKLKPTKQNISLRLAILGLLPMAGTSQKPTATLRFNLDTIFEKATITFSQDNPTTAKIQRQRAREAVFYILDDLKNNKVIIDYEPRKKGNAIVGVEIRIKPSVLRK